MNVKELKEFVSNQKIEFRKNHDIAVYLFLKQLWDAIDDLTEENHEDNGRL